MSTQCSLVCAAEKSETRIVVSIHSFTYQTFVDYIPCIRHVGMPVAFPEQLVKLMEADR